MNQRACAACGTALAADARATAKTCSPACSQEYRVQHKRKAARDYIRKKRGATKIDDAPAPPVRRRVVRLKEAPERVGMSKSDLYAELAMAAANTAAVQTDDPSTAAAGAAQRETPAQL
jgi:predicted RNA-binding Zn-ribbon protein involved in translation (DUF1610 family)